MVTRILTIKSASSRNSHYFTVVSNDDFECVINFLCYQEYFFSYYSINCRFSVSVNGSYNVFSTVRLQRHVEWMYRQTVRSLLSFYKMKIHVAIIRSHSLIIYNQPNRDNYSALSTFALTLSLMKYSFGRSAVTIWK